MEINYLEIARMIDHSLLDPGLTDRALEEGCNLAVRYNVAGVCVMPFYVRQACRILEGTGVIAGTTVGFPHGGQTTAVKIQEAEQALLQGVHELDMVVNISKALSADWDYVRQEIEAVLDAAHGAGGKLKVIFENCYLNDEQKIALCRICGELGVDWVKTSTGYGQGGATLHDVSLMRKYSPPQVQIKAAGGIRTLDRLLEMRDAGATRIGASRTQSILDELRQRLGET
jgi:deoxyribose-phosphate aldolase